MADYPPLPGVFDVPWGLVRVWSTAKTHIMLVQLYTDGLDAFVHHPELTAGPHCICGTEPDIWCPRDDHARHAWATPAGCICRDATWYPGRPIKRNCPVHGWPYNQWPCTCHYALKTFSMAVFPGRVHTPHQLVVTGSYFTIHNDCPHHGEDARWENWAPGSWQYERWALDQATEAAFMETLDEAERTGH